MYQWLIDNKSIWIPVALYLALNIANRTALVTNANPEIRFIARLLENVLFMQWDKWGGTLKVLAPPVNEDTDGK